MKNTIDQKENKEKEQAEWHEETLKELKGKLSILERSNFEGENDEEIKGLKIDIENYKKGLDMVHEKLGRQPRTRETEEASRKLIDSIFKIDEAKRIKEAAEILKNNKISQIIVHGQENEEQSKKWGLSLKRDLDTQTALYILNNLTNKSGGGLYAENALVSFVPKGGKIGNIEEEAQRKGARLAIDTGGSWLKVEKHWEGQTPDTQTIYLDHHGAEQRKPTSATEQMYKVLNEAGLIKEPEPAWLRSYIKFVNEFDNLTYLDKRDQKGNKIYDKEYFEKKWIRTPYALADFMPAELIKAYQSGKIKDLSAPLSNEQIKEMGGENLFKKLDGLKSEVKETVNGIEVSEINNKKEGLDLQNTRVGKIVFHDFPKIKPANGKEFVNKIKNGQAFVGTKMLGSDTYICWNKQNGTFFLNSKHPNIEEVVDDLEKTYPGSIAKDIRGEIIFGKITEGMTKEKFLNIIDPKILKNAGKNTPEKNIPRKEKNKGRENKNNNQEGIKEKEKILERINIMQKFYLDLKNNSEKKLELAEALETGNEDKITEVKKKLYAEFLKTKK